MADEIMLNVAQVVALFNVSRQTFWKMRRKGLFPKGSRINGARAVRWTLAEVRAWQEEHRRQQEAESR